MFPAKPKVHSVIVVHRALRLWLVSVNLPLRRVLLMALSVRDENEPKHARIFERLADP